MADEQQLIQDVLDGKTDAFRGIIERYQRPVLRMVSNLVYDRHTAEDIAQEVFVAAYQKLATFDPTLSRFSTWLFMIARNKSINYLRKNKPVASLEIDAVENPGVGIDPIERREFFRQMDQGLNRLPLRQKRAFVMAEFEQLPYDQIAQVECVSIGTVKSRIHRAKKKLRKHFEAIMGDD